MIFERPINKLIIHKVNRTVATTLVYLLIVVFLAGLIYLTVPIVVDNVTPFSKLLSQNTVQNQVTNLINGKIGLSTTSAAVSTNILSIFGGEVGAWWENITRIFKTLGNVGDSLGKGVLVVMMAYYLNLKKGGVRSNLAKLLPEKNQEMFNEFWPRIQYKVDSWFYSQLLISIIIGIIVFIGLLLLQVRYSYFLGILAAFLDFIPYVGPAIALGLIVVVSIKEGWITVVFAAALFLFAQNLESIVAPYFRGKMIKMDPIMIILALLIGGSLGGAIGMVLAIPLAAIASEVIQDKKIMKAIFHKTEYVPVDNEQNLMSKV
jgi:predicted PurR-regulated permease PerM